MTSPKPLRARPRRMRAGANAARRHFEMVDASPHLSAGGQREHERAGAEDEGGGERQPEQRVPPPHVQQDVVRRRAEKERRRRRRAARRGTQDDIARQNHNHVDASKRLLTTRCARRARGLWAAAGCGRAALRSHEFASAWTRLRRESNHEIIRSTALKKASD
eukprot:3580144-Prymnesium_polylepis.2